MLVLDSIATTFLINQIEDIKLILAEKAIHIKIIIIIVSIFEKFMLANFFNLGFNPFPPSPSSVEDDRN